MRVDSPLSLQQLTYFIEVVNAGSITKAAAALFVSQPSLSAAIKEIETRTGTELFTRSARGVALTPDGVEFLGYARQVVEQADLLGQRWLSRKPSRRMLAVSTQHYAFAVNAFVAMVEQADADEYEFTLRETRTHDIIEDVRTLRSELGILYLNDFNRKVLEKLFREGGVVFNPLFTARPHIFVSETNPLAGRTHVTPRDLADLPKLSFDQGENNSFHFAEEILSTEYSKRSIRVSDRATIFNLMIGLGAYTISTGIVSPDLNPGIVAVPLRVDERIEIGWISHGALQISIQASRYLDEVRKIVTGFGVRLHS